MKPFEQPLQPLLRQGETRTLGFEGGLSLGRGGIWLVRAELGEPSVEVRRGALSVCARMRASVSARSFSRSRMRVWRLTNKTAKANASTESTHKTPNRQPLQPFMASPF